MRVEDIRLHVRRPLTWMSSPCATSRQDPHIEHSGKALTWSVCLVQKSGINAKNDNVKVLGIRVREVMHERRIELLESAAVQPGGLPPGATFQPSACLLPNICAARRLHTAMSSAVHDAGTTPDLSQEAFDKEHLCQS